MADYSELRRLLAREATQDAANKAWNALPGLLDEIERLRTDAETADRALDEANRSITEHAQRLEAERSRTIRIENATPIVIMDGETAKELSNAAAFGERCRDEEALRSDQALRQEMALDRAELRIAQLEAAMPRLLTFVHCDMGPDCPRPEHWPDCAINVARAISRDLGAHTDA